MLRFHYDQSDIGAMTSQRANQLSEKFFTRRSLVRFKKDKKGRQLHIFSEEKVKSK